MEAKEIQEVNEIFEQIAKGEKSSPLCQRLYDLMANELFRFILKRCRIKSEVDDILQETFLTALASANKLTSFTRCHNWMKGIAIKKISNLNKKAYVRREACFDKAKDMLSDFSNSQIKTEIDIALEKLPKQESEIFALNTYFGYTLKELAKTYKLSEVTIKRRFKDAKTRLKKELDYETFKEKN